MALETDSLKKNPFIELWGVCWLVGLGLVWGFSHLWHIEVNPGIYKLGLGALIHLTFHNSVVFVRTWEVFVQIEEKKVMVRIPSEKI